AYLSHAGTGAPERAVLAVATSPNGDRVAFTNNPWTFSVAELTEHLSGARLRVVNDFYANALAVPQLIDTDVRKIGGGAALPHTPIGVIGPGSGLGVSAVVPQGNGYLPVASEGGHVTMAAASEEESAVLD